MSAAKKEREVRVELTSKIKARRETRDPTHSYLSSSLLEQYAKRVKRISNLAKLTDMCLRTAVGSPTLVDPLSDRTSCFLASHFGPRKILPYESHLLQQAH